MKKIDRKGVVAGIQCTLYFLIALFLVCLLIGESFTALLIDNILLISIVIVTLFVLGAKLKNYRWYYVS